MAGSAPVPLRFCLPEPLTVQHKIDKFDCGTPSLNDFLQRYALANQANGSARTFITLAHNLPDALCMGYYSLAAASAEHATTPKRVSKGLAKHPIPMLLLARLAVDKTAQGAGVGRSLLLDALQKYLQASEVIGCRALMVHAKDAAAARFYKQYGFEPSPVDEFHLYLLTKDIRKTLAHT
jgi:GNAT superfamily N-acetyltransferase